MDISYLIDPLNDAQREAVTVDSQYALILAGAGSGKTRVLVHRIAYLVGTGQARPHHILAVTFTNKAAKEMQIRIEKLIGTSLQGMWVGTFHGIAHRLLRLHWKEANLPQSFQVLDSEEQKRIIKRVIRSLELDDKIWTPKQIQIFINQCKENRQRAKDVIADEDDKKIRIYHAYEQYCQNIGVVDFAELLLKTYELLKNNDELCLQYQQRFRYILVDEFQDTNVIQYLWLQLLGGEKNNIFVVGDEDQSIYTWRGAKIENILNFSHDFANTHAIRLEQNYRSSGTILAASNKLIAHNKKRLGKNLWTKDKPGEPIYLYSAINEQDEAEFVVARLQTWQGQRKEVAILYRTAAQSRIFEEALLQNNIPYRIYGGLRFYECAEVKDTLAYLRLIAHYNDDTAFERIVNLPKRNIGDKTLESVRALARQQGLSLWQASHFALENNKLTKRAATALQKFLDLMADLARAIASFSLSDKVAYMNEHSGLLKYYQQGSKEESQRRLENLQELVTAAKEFERVAKDGNNPLSEFLAHAALESGEGQGHYYEDCVQLMTLHLAKGLEFDVVFLCGLEDGLFPHDNSINEGNLEEERRLCYVGMTRARQYLYLCHSESRMRYGLRDMTCPSRFLQEIPQELIQDVKLKSPVSQFQFKHKPFKIGEKVKHAIFGEGYVLAYEGAGELARVHVAFSNEGDKWLIVAYAGLEIISEI